MAQMSEAMAVPKAASGDFLGRFREIVQDPLNLLITRSLMAGVVDSEGMVTLHNGLRVPVSGPDAYYSEFSEILVINRGVHEPLEEFIFQEALRRISGTGVMLELGAYWGHYSMWAKLRRPGLDCVLVEPEAASLEVGRRNFARNGLDGRFLQGRIGAGELTLDAICANQGFASVEILHADIQGAEAHLLGQGIERLRQHAVDLNFLSTHGQDLHLDAESRPAALGYAIVASADFSTETTSFDGFIFAVAPAFAGQWPNASTLGRQAICQCGPGDLLTYIATLQSAFGISRSLSV